MNKALRDFSKVCRVFLERNGFRQRLFQVEAGGVEHDKWAVFAKFRTGRTPVIDLASKRKYWIDFADCGHRVAREKGERHDLEDQLGKVRRRGFGSVLNTRRMISLPKKVKGSTYLAQRNRSLQGIDNVNNDGVE